MVHLYKNGFDLNNYGKDQLANNFIDNIDRFLWGNTFQMSEWFFGQTRAKRKGLPIKTNQINSEQANNNSSENQQSNNELHLEGLQKLRNQYHSNPLIVYLNIHFVQHKTDSLGEIIKRSPLEAISGY